MLKDKDGVVESVQPTTWSQLPMNQGATKGSHRTIQVPRAAKHLHPQEVARGRLQNQGAPGKQQPMLANPHVRVPFQRNADAATIFQNQQISKHKLLNLQIT